MILDRSFSVSEKRQNIEEISEFQYAFDVRTSEEHNIF